MNRFIFVVFVFLAGAMVLSAVEPQKPLRPNIVVLLSDDLGWADVGWHGSEIKTPHLDKLAQAGVRMEQFYVQPVCSPTRACLMTGRYPMRYGLQSGPIMYQENYGLSTEERMLPEALHEAGYVTAICGKWHLGHVKPEYLPMKRGFDHQYGIYLGQTDYYTHSRAGKLDWYRNGEIIKEEGYTTNLIASEAVRIIGSHDYVSTPLFLYVAFNAVHSPYQEAPGDQWKQDYATLKGVRKTYAGMVTTMDEQIGRITDAISKKGIANNTIVFFFNDNGGPQPDNITSNRPLRAGKGTLYEGGVRVPACAVWPGKIKPGTVSNEPVHVVDLYPTFLNLAGVSLKQKLPLDGVDQKSAIIDGGKSARTEMLLNTTPSNGAIRMGDWKLVVRGTASGELFNLADDPSEKNNLADANPEKLKELTARYSHYAKQAVPPLKKKQAADNGSDEAYSQLD